MKFKLIRYILPSVVSMVLVGAYTNIDGLFIGNVSVSGVENNDVFLNAINFVWPIVAFITSLGTGIGVGGSVIVGSLRGEGRFDEAEKAKRTSLYLLVIAGVLSSVVFGVWYKPLLSVMGAEGDVLTYAGHYALVVSLGSLFQVLGSGLVMLLRCEGKTVRAMLYTTAGLFVHVLLNFLLVNSVVMYGVALSSVAAQAVITLLSFISFRVRGKAAFSFAFAGEIMRSACAPFGVNFVSSAVLLFTNYFATAVGGVAAVSAYTVMSYVVYTYDYVFQGVCDGVQPVVSYCVGAGDEPQIRRTVRAEVLLLAVLSAAFSLLTPLMIFLLPKIFAISAEAAEMMRSGMVVYAFSYPLKACVKFMCSYCYSHKKVWVANLLTYADPLLFSPLLLALLPQIWGADGLWLSLTLSQAAIVLLGGVLFFAMRVAKKRRLRKNSV